ncbi:GntR family transcriptional regulator [Nonomuraea gerenzanensis]|uniref:Transcriptional regulator, GntR family n=1 Tax=Nonomuraea gerenzanensis TaxID=93944 RepID=A0A1M4E6P5_9ACTN|nr:GntR family transcriptional regulator [Nonomuraea gerenzanensis]UBU16730.1 GntR family transcriptional regulator [Nonomuraea gerenzanensis]SBO94434.1 Transcriptional regulator, GntR family [Nonomuraea gerenzanensis]
MLLTLDLNDARPLHEQVASAIRRAIGEGSYRPGDRLPPARDLAAALGINPNTVLRALRDLRDEGLLEFRRGRGVSVAGRADGRALLVQRVRELLDEAEKHGYSRNDLITIMEELA